MHVDDDSDTDADAEAEAEALLLPKSRSRSRSQVSPQEQQVVFRGSAAAGTTVPLFRLSYSVRGKVLLSHLHTHLVAVIHAAYDRMEAHLYLVDAYPDRVPRHKTSFMQEALEDGTGDCDEPEILKKLQTDRPWAHELHKLVSSFVTMLYAPLTVAA